MALRLAVLVGLLSIVATAAAKFGFGEWVSLFAFTPAAVLHGYVWQLVTYGLFEPIGSGFGVFNFLISIYVLFVIGGQIEQVIGPRRFLLFYLGSTAFGAALTLPIAFIMGWQFQIYSGLWVAIGALTVYFAFLHANQPINLFFFLPVQGRMLVWISFGILALLALAGGSPAPLVPAFFGMLYAVFQGRGFSLGLSPRRTWLRFRAWRIERELKKRSSHLSVIKGGRENPPPPSKKKDGSGPWLH